MALYYITSNKYSLQERVLKSGKKVYDVVFCVITLDGQRKQKWLRGFENKSLAKAYYLKYVTENCEVTRRSPIKKKDPDKEKLLVGDLVKQYMATLGNQNKYSVIYDKNNIFRIYILNKYENTPIDALTKEELYKWQDELWATVNPKTGKFYSQRYLVKIRTFFNTFLTWVEQRYRIRNNLVDVKKPKYRKPPKMMQFWTREQFEVFIDCVDDPMYHALFTFAFFTGQRLGELLALTPADVKTTTITINKNVTRKTITGEAYGIVSTKADKSQTIPVCKTVQREIKAYTPGDKFYFGGDKPLNDNTVRRRLERYTDIAGLPQIRFHDLRHSFVSMLIHLGANVMVVADLINDTVEQVIKTYGHLYQSDKLDIISQLR